MLHSSRARVRSRIAGAQTLETSSRRGLGQGREVKQRFSRSRSRFRFCVVRGSVGAENLPRSSRACCKCPPSLGVLSGKNRSGGCRLEKKTRATELLEHVPRSVEEVLAVSNAIFLLFVLRKQRHGIRKVFESSGILQGEAEAGEKGVLVDGNAAGMVTERREEQTRSADEGEVSGNSGFSSDILPKLLLSCFKPSKRKELLQISLDTLMEKKAELEESKESSTSSCESLFQDTLECVAERWAGAGGLDIRKMLDSGDNGNEILSLMDDPSRGNELLELAESDWLPHYAVCIAETIADAYVDTTADLSQYAIFDSTRKILRFKNSVQLYRIYQHYLFSVQMMYEDKYRLWSFCSDTGALVQKSICRKRSSELSELTGFRRTYGLLLEAWDVFLPLARRLFDFFQEGLQLLLVLVIGRGLGLIWRGIKEGCNNSFTSTSKASFGNAQRNRRGDGNNINNNVSYSF